MIRTLRQTEGLWGRVCMTLAVIALALKILVPGGYMLAGPQSAQPFALVICTGHGALVLDSDQSLAVHGQDQAPTQTAHDNACGFAGHGLSAPPLAMADIGAATFASYAAPVARLSPDLAPGRGLTGPPLPARGPPSSLT